MSDLISIVLPTYNGERYLSESIDSIIAQTYTNWELIIVNDCSTDSTQSIANNYAEKDQRIKVIKNEINLRLPASLNRGFESAKGEFLTWTSDDNRYKPLALQRMHEELLENPDAALVYADKDDIDSDGNLLERHKLPEPDNLPYFNHIGACFMYRHEVLDTIGGYDDNLFCAEDYDYWFRIYLKYKLVLLSENLYEYRMHPGSLTSRRDKLVEESCFQIMSKYLNHCHWVSKADRSKIVAKKVRKYIMRRYWMLALKASFFGLKSAGFKFTGDFFSVIFLISKGIIQKYCLSSKVPLR